LSGGNPTDFNELHYYFLGNLQYSFFISCHSSCTSSHKKAPAGWKKACFFFTQQRLLRRRKTVYSTPTLGFYIPESMTRSKRDSGFRSPELESRKHFLLISSRIVSTVGCSNMPLWCREKEIL
jgi:hypothetical protein